jgi:phospholipid/cholesterol/gamma-HCH transport system substrate-binding protein
VKDLASVTSVLVKQKRALEEFLDNSATALTNLQLAYNPKSGTLDTRDNGASQTTPQSVICGLLGAAGQTCPAGFVSDAPTYGTDRSLGGILAGGTR